MMNKGKTDVELINAMKNGTDETNVTRYICSDANIHNLYQRQRLIMIRYEQGMWFARWYPCNPNNPKSDEPIAIGCSLTDVFNTANRYRLEVAAILLYDMDPIDVYGRDQIVITENRPFMAIEQDGTVVSFNRGYYLTEVDDFVSCTLIEYVREYLRESHEGYRLQPEIDVNGNDITEGFKLPLPSKYSYFVKASGYYEIDTQNESITKNKVHGLANGYIYNGSLKDAVMDVMSDKDKEKNDFPIIVLSKNKNYVILDNWDVMRIEKGFINRYHNISANEAFDIFFNNQVENALNA